MFHVSLAFGAPSAEGTRPCSHLRPDPMTTSLTLWQKAGWQQSFLKKAGFVVEVSQRSLSCSCSHVCADKTPKQSPRRRVRTHFSPSNSDKWLEMRAQISKVKISSRLICHGELMATCRGVYRKKAKHFIDKREMKLIALDSLVACTYLFGWLMSYVKVLQTGFQLEIVNSNR